MTNYLEGIIKTTTPDGLTKSWYKINGKTYSHGDKLKYNHWFDKVKEGFVYIDYLFYDLSGRKYRQDVKYIPLKEFVNVFI